MSPHHTSSHTHICNHFSLPFPISPFQIGSTVRSTVLACTIFIYLKGEKWNKKIMGWERRGKMFFVKWKSKGCISIQEPKCKPFLHTVHGWRKWHVPMFSWSPVCVITIPVEVLWHTNCDLIPFNYLKPVLLKKINDLCIPITHISQQFVRIREVGIS